MDADEIADLLGRPSSDPVVEAVLARFGIEDRPQVKTVDQDSDGGPILETDDWLLNSAGGIEFGFEDEAAFLGHDKFEYGAGPMLLTQIYMYGVHQGVRPYAYPPFGLRHTDDRQTVRTKLRAGESRRRSYVRDAWELEPFTLIVGYAHGEAAVDFVLALRRHPPLPPVSTEVTSVPSVQEINDLFGKGWLDPELRETFRPFGLERQAAELRGGPLATFRRMYGFDLAFHPPSYLEKRPVRAVWGPLFSEIVFFRERMLGARGWKGRLPLGLHFDDSPEDVLNKVRRPPNDRSDDDFTGWMVWHLPDYSLQVHYTSMENFILRVRMMAPGVWSSLQAA